MDDVNTQSRRGRVRRRTAFSAIATAPYVLRRLAHFNPLDEDQLDRVEGRVDQFSAFVGHAVAEAERDMPPARRLVPVVLDATSVDVSGDEVILAGDDPVGFVTSGGNAHHLGRSMAMGYVATEHTLPATSLEVEALGSRTGVEVLGEPLHDANGGRMRAT